MRTISAERIKDIVAELCIKANIELRKDVLKSLEFTLERETRIKAKRILQAIVRNALIAKKERLAICQDTGMPIVFLEIGQDIRIKGDIYKKIKEGVILGYRRGYFRDSIVEPFKRKKTTFAPPVIHTELVKGNRLKVTVLPKGFGCENKTVLKMFNPTMEWNKIKDFIVETVKLAGPDACPPFVVGVGIGGTSDYACFLAKKALLKKIGNSGVRKNSLIFRLEEELLNSINKLNIGPMGLGGKISCLGIKIMSYPTHIAGLPVAVNINCHALRSAEAII